LSGKLVPPAGEVETRFYAQIGAAREGEPVLIDLARSS